MCVRMPVSSSAEKKRILLKNTLFFLMLRLTLTKNTIKLGRFDIKENINFKIIRDDYKKRNF